MSVAGPDAVPMRLFALLGSLAFGFGSLHRACVVLSSIRWRRASGPNRPPRSGAPSAAAATPCILPAAGGALGVTPAPPPAFLTVADNRLPPVPRAEARRQHEGAAIARHHASR